MPVSREHTRAFVGQLALPETGPRYEGVESEPIKFEAGPQAVVIGAQIAQFAESVDAETRSAIADSLLIAQLAANKAADSSSDVVGWYRKYIEVLQNLGWIVRDLEFRDQKISDANAGVHTAIIPVVTAMLVPGTAALAMVLPILNGLKEMDSTSKWMTVFDRASQHARGAKFQLSYVEADGAGNPVISALCFGLLAEHTLTQVLFFKFSQDNVSMQSANGSLSMTLEHLKAARDAIAARVRPFVTDFVADLNI
jgi:hypothetical protein